MTAAAPPDADAAGSPDATASFAKSYGREPDGTWFAPGRVNLMGGPDYTEGFVLPFALGAGVTVTAARRKDRRIALTSRQQDTEPIELDIDTLEPGSVPGWAAYPAGVAWVLRQAGYLEHGADIAIDADLPVGASLSSSAALEFGSGQGGLVEFGEGKGDGAFERGRGGQARAYGQVGVDRDVGAVF